MVFKRDLLEELKRWKEKGDRMPLILHGARQTGKTWLLKHFGETCFEDFAYFNFDEQEDLKELFSDKNPTRIIRDLSILRGKTIDVGRTLLFLDEIQECNTALNSLKYFCEQMPQLAVVCAGSLLGVSLQQGMSFPVGKVNHLYLHPLTFKEYLHSADADMYRYLDDIVDIKPMPEIFFNRIMSVFNDYLICGGMPRPAQTMIDSRDTDEVGYLQQQIIDDYRSDFAKHADKTDAVRIGYVFDSIPSQLGKENKKFIYQLVRPGARAREYENALLWLRKAGLTRKVGLCREPRLPLSAYDNLSVFKEYLVDVGLLRRLAKLPPRVFLNKSAAFTEFKGAMAENYVLQSLSAQMDVPLRYWTGNRNAEVDFLLQYDMDIIPIEVKSGINTRARSLSFYAETFNPQACLRYSEKNLIRQERIINIPLFMTDFTDKILKLSQSRPIS